jgi:hypothetical protein
VAGIEDAAAVGEPDEVASGGAGVDAGKHLVNLAAVGDVEEMHVAGFRPGVRQRDGHRPAVGRGDEPVDRRHPFGIDGIRVDQDALIRERIERGENDQKRLLFRRLALDGKQRAFAVFDGREADRLRRHDFGHARANLGDIRQDVKHRSGVGILSVAPLADGRVVPVFEPAVIVNDGCPVINIGNRLLRSVGRHGSHGDGEEKGEEHVFEVFR